MKPTTLLLLAPLSAAIAQTTPSHRDHLLQKQLEQKKACTEACPQEDTDCRAICDHAPHPKAIHMNLMTQCVDHCDVLKGDGTAGDLARYGECHKSCIDGYMALDGGMKAPETKTWVDFVTPSSTVVVSQGAKETKGAKGEGEKKGEGSVGGSGGESSSVSLATASGITFTNGVASGKATGTANLASTTRATTTAKATASAKANDDKEEKAAESGASIRHVGAFGGLIGAAVIGMFLL